MQKKKQSQSRKVSQKNREHEQEQEILISSDNDTQDFSELEQNQQYYSIIQWKKLQEEKVLKMAGNNLITQSSKHQDDLSKLQTLPLKSCLKKIKQDELFGKISDDQMKTQISSEKMQHKEQQIKQCIIVTEFNNIMNEDNDDEISITLDEVDDFIYKHTEQKKNQKFDLTQFDSIKKRIVLNQKIQFDHYVPKNNQ
ncbi:unnamed protein product (macronuclear) [Paramecium tetraurelia]|uniref:Uncharacterized protein n=1 Tax=Paramecium tetraurelia TaxID=5888 RepID=A0CU68_PARTE|nr:uncharacterized protein GSPATT00010534001 [Paramecium tetraurelia]CAK74335.1 unnamed protein product [Paramecium tetraurelia]|eukprot:XP_001441732.1 hypothetical protein (macronuclear) [Paramecium tetraurelia strain d4-2]